MIENREMTPFELMLEEYNSITEPILASVSAIMMSRCKSAGVDYDEWVEWTYNNMESD